MSAENERTIVIAETRSGFEAETIAAALRERGVDARVLDSATSQAWGMAISGVSVPKVVVLEHEEGAARTALEMLRVESQSIDWDAVDLGSDPRVERLRQMSLSRRWVFTVMLLLVPAGFAVFVVGTQRGDRLIQLLGGVMLAAAITMGVIQVLPDRDEDEEPPRGG